MRQRDRDRQLVKGLAEVLKFDETKDEIVENVPATMQRIVQMVQVQPIVVAFQFHPLTKQLTLLQPNVKNSSETLSMISQACTQVAQQYSQMALKLVGAEKNDTVAEEGRVDEAT